MTLGTFTVRVALGLNRLCDHCYLPVLLPLLSAMHFLLIQRSCPPGQHMHAPAVYTLGVGERTADGDEPPLVIADIRSGSAGDPGYKATA